MPVLAQEPCLYPADLFDAGAPTNAGHSWWVLHTLPRQEKSLARQLLGSQTPFYLPVVANRIAIRGRVFESRLPLFPGYVFLLAQPEQRLAALATRRVANSLPVPDQRQLWDDLIQLYRLVSSGLPVRPEDKLVPGTKVVIWSGPLAGLRGTILKAASGHRFVVQVNFIQRGASVVLDDFALKAVSADDGDSRA